MSLGGLSGLKNLKKLRVGGAEYFFDPPVLRALPGSIEELVLDINGSSEPGLDECLSCVGRLPNLKRLRFEISGPTRNLGMLRLLPAAARHDYLNYSLLEFRPALNISSE